VNPSGTGLAGAALKRVCSGRFLNAPKGNHMLKWTIIFLVVALIAGLLGFASLAGTAAGIARILFVIFLVLFLATLIQRNA
jgi:uncharacterized membrane protein YtjA (UPF0391 family)